MPRLEMGQSRDCTACGKPFVGARTMGGAIVPIEIDPDPNGNVLLQRRRDGTVVAITMGGQLLTLAREAGMELRVNHMTAHPAAEPQVTT
jgi:hypothetical protein